LKLCPSIDENFDDDDSCFALENDTVIGLLPVLTETVTPAISNDTAVTPHTSFSLLNKRNE
jgi:hypothetical protein